MSRALRGSATSPAVVIKSNAHSFTDQGWFPRHYDREWRHPVGNTLEVDAIASLKAAWQAQGHAACNGYMENKKTLIIELNDYEIYSIPEENFFGELHSLDHMDASGKKLQFSGVLSIKGIKRQFFVQTVPIRSYSIEGYGVDDDPSISIYLSSHQTSRDREYDIWYKLGSPSRQYKCFHDAFKWVATLGKHVIDFLQADDHHHNGLNDFRHTFLQWIRRRFPGHPVLEEWCKAYGSSDFRKVVHAHITYLWSEAVCLDDKALLEQHLWDQCGRRDNEMIPPRCAKTVATPHVYKCFKNRYFAGQLTELHPSEDVRAAREDRMSTFGLKTEASTFSKPTSQSSQRCERVQIGDVISIIPDDEENRQWRKSAKDTSTVQEWLGYVHRISPYHDGTQRLYVIWLYRPEDTTISTTDYPIKKELFLSDNCNCHDQVLLSSDVYRRYSVQWFSKGYDTTEDFLVRQKYNTRTSSFITMRTSDFHCTCQRSAPDAFEQALRQGDTVYVSGKGTLNPVVVEENFTMEKKIRVRRLMRVNDVQAEFRHATKSSHAANELVWTDETELVSYAKIDGKCHVRFFPRKLLLSSGVPFPYDQNGAVHCWVLTMRLVADHLEEMTEPPRGIQEGPQFTSHDQAKKLPGLSLFSGIGNLDKGLEAGGAVHFHTSIDMNGRAIQTLRANSEDSLKLWFGSVDDYLQALLSGHSAHKDLVAKIGNVSVIAAGSPCPGFSKLQQDWQSEQSLRNAAHVTTFASFVDVYRPEYGFLENVVNMGATRKGYEEELVLSQLVGCMVSMGYQVQQFIMSSWNYGSPQHRNRLIISIAAPGRTPIMQPRTTHGDHSDFKSKSLGKLLNGERFGVQDSQLTPFRHVTAGDAIGNLPDIGCGIKHPCIPWPDHVLRLRPNIKERRALSYIPTYPPGVGLEYAAKHGLIPSYLYEKKSEITGKCYKRFKKNGLIGTIVTAPSPHDSRSGPFVHYEQNRCLSLEEARIAQGIPKEEVLIGGINDQFKMVGNAVDRRVSTALGFELRKAFDQDARKTRSIRKQSVSVVIGIKDRIRTTFTQVDAEDQIVEASETTLRISKYQSNGFEEAHKVARGTLKSSTTCTSFSERETYESYTINTSITKSSDVSGATRTDRTTEVKCPTKHVSKTTHKPQDTRKQSGTAPIDDRHVEFDQSTASPVLATSRNGFPGILAKSLNTCGYDIPVREKRARDQHSAKADHDDHTHSREEPTQKKRLKKSQSTETIGQSPVRDSERGSVDSIGTSQDSVVRRTRHSGMEVEFVPKHWNKTVERDVTATDTVSKKFHSRPYA